MLDAAGVKLLSAGIDEAPVAYKDIHAVMAAQRDLVQVIARFDPEDREDGRRRREAGGLILSNQKAKRMSHG